MDPLSVAVLDLAVEHALAGVAAEIGLEQAHGDPALRVDLERAREHRQDLEDVAEVRGREAARRERRHRHDVDLPVGEAERHGDVIGRAFGVQVAHDREIERDVRLLEPAPDPARALDDRRERAVGELRLVQDVVRLEDRPRRARVVAPDEDARIDLRVQRRDDDGHPRDGDAVREQAVAELLDELLGRRRPPGLAQQPRGERIGVRALDAFGGEVDLAPVVAERAHLAPVEGYVTPDAGRVAERPLVGPGGVLHRFAARAERPVTGVALERAIRLVRGLREQLGAHVGPGNVQDGPQARLVQHDRARRIGDARSVELDAQPPRIRLDPYGVFDHPRCVHAGRASAKR